MRVADFENVLRAMSSTQRVRLHRQRKAQCIQMFMFGANRVNLIAALETLDLLTPGSSHTEDQVRTALEQFIEPLINEEI